MQGNQDNQFPNYYALRNSLRFIAGMFESLMPFHHCVDIPETIRLMLADFFYGDLIETKNPCLSVNDRVLVLRPGLVPPEYEQMLMMETTGDIFWALNDFITRNLLTINNEAGQTYVYRPHEIFYTFWPQTYDLMIYVPVMQECVIEGFAMHDGRAVMSATRQTWPKYITNRLQKNK